MKAISRTKTCFGALRIVVAALMALVGWSTARADMIPVVMPDHVDTRNYLYVGDVACRPGVTVDIPVYLANWQSVVSAQFDIKLPFEIPSNGTATLSARSVGHSASFTAVSGKANTYRVVVTTFQNNYLRGNKGILLTLPVVVPQSAAGQSYDISLSDVVLTDKQGNNIATSRTGTGVLRVERGDLPDLTVRNVHVSPSSTGPGGELAISYSVVNIGGGSTLSGWTEKFYLQGSTGVRLYLGSRYHSDILAKDASTSGNFMVTLPHVLHVDGQCHALVEVVPNSNTGELLSDRGNNTGVSVDYTTVSKTLTLVVNKGTIYEGLRYGYATLTLTRSGDWSRAETFRITADVQNLVTCNGLTLPCQVTIPALSSGTSLRIAAVDDKIVRARQVTLTVTSQNGYNEVKATLQRVDNDRNPFSIQLSPNPLDEGQKLTMTLTRGGELTDVLDVTATCSQASRFSGSLNFHFDAGQSTSTQTLTAIDNDIIELDQSVRFTATATDYALASATLKLQDDDRPAITLTLSQPSVTENMDTDDDGLPLVATITRDRGVDRAATVYLTSSRPEVVFERSQVTFGAGESVVYVPIHITDNSSVDGTRKATLAAALYIASAGRSASAGDRAYSARELTIVDDEQPYLTLSARVSAVAEGGSATITVRRVQADVSAPCTVSLTCDDARVTFQPTPVTIAAGSRTATTTIRVARNSVTDDDADVLVRATAPQLADAYLRLHITDRTLPDAVCTKLECIGPKFYSGLPATLRATIRNYGTKVLPAGMTIDVYISTSRSHYYWVYRELLCKVTTDAEIAPGDEKAFEFEAQLPQRVGEHWVYAYINSNRAITELDYGNNRSRQFGYMNILAPFQVSEVSVRPEDALPGQVVTVSGRMTAVEDGLLNEQTVRIRLVGKGQSSTTDTRIDPLGNFSANVRVDRSAYGWLTVQATALGQTAASRTTRLHVYNQSLYCSDGTRWVVDEGSTKSGYFTWVNLSAKPITIKSFRLTEPVPDGCTIRLTPPTGTIGAGESVRINYSITATKPTSEWQRFSVIASSVEGLETTMPIDFRCQATSSYLVFSPTRISTTMLFGRNRTYSVTVTNRGRKSTGALTAMAQDPWVLHDADRLGSLAPGQSATIHFTFLHDETKHVGRTYKSYFQLKPTEGRAVGLPISITVTGHEYSNFAVRASDVYVLAQGDYSHVAGASVVVTNVRTGRVVHSGTVDAQGIWRNEHLEEGLYDITLSKVRHLTTRRRIAVGPGEDRSISIFMPYRALIGNFVVRHDDDGDFFYMEQTFDIDGHAPQAIVKAEIADRGFECGRDTMDIVLQNIGSRAALRSRLSFPYVNGCSFTFLNDMPAVLEPGDKHILTVAYEGPENGKRRVVSTIKMYYEFEVDGHTLYEEDSYKALFGCGKRINIDPNPQPNDPDCYGDDCNNPYPHCDGCGGDDGGDGGDGGGGNDDHIDVEAMGEPWIPLPSYGGYWMLVLDADSVHVGEQLGATLRVLNQYTSAYRQMRFIPQTSDLETYEWRTELFTFSEGEQTGFTADGSFRQLAAQSEGSLRVLLTPLPEAAPDGRQQYGLGGQLQYIDPQTGMHMTASLYDYVITVLPGTGEVELTYLIGRHFVNDDPATEEIELQNPGTFALLAQGKNETAFRGLSLANELPAVLANANGHVTGLNGEWAGVNGEAGNYSFEDFSYVADEALNQLAARWIYTTLPSAHTDDINTVAETLRPNLPGMKFSVNKPRELVRAVSSTALAQPFDLSAETELGARIKAMTLGDVYLLNDADDELSLPDVVLSPEGEESDLQDVSSKITITSNGTVGEAILHISADAAGWAYLRVSDPTAGLMRLTSVSRRSDGKYLSPANFWQTELTPQADYSLLQENIMHLADRLPSSEEDYLLHFDERPGAPIQILKIHLYMADGTEVMDGATTTKPVTKIVVEFTGGIEKMWLNAFGLRRAGRPEDLGEAMLSDSDGKRQWTVDISSLPVTPGEHSVTLKGKKLKGTDGRSVVGTETVTWTEELAGEANVTITVAPEADYGTTTPTSGTLAFGEHTFIATPAQGYAFVSWQDGADGSTLSTQNTVRLDIQGDRSLVARFTQEYCDIVVLAENGQLLGNITGLFPYGQQIQLAVQPDEGYLFDHWERQGQHLSDDAITTDRVQGNATYVAVIKVVPDGISGIIDSDRPADIYSLTGLKLRSEAADVRAALRALPPGIYIVNGQKVLRR